jgi:hypothetical protein
MNRRGRSGTSSSRPPLPWDELIAPWLARPDVRRRRGFATHHVLEEAIGLELREMDVDDAEVVARYLRAHGWRPRGGPPPRERDWIRLQLVPARAPDALPVVRAGPEAPTQGIARGELLPAPRVETPVDPEAMARLRREMRARAARRSRAPQWTRRR